mgnify:CR=1 FL=1
MSGGVDSSVAAALLKRDGFRVVGVYMKCWSEGLACTSEDDERSARLAAAHLEIPFYTWNFIKEYRERVVQYMLVGYQKGITPNPDIMCNKEIKFGLFFDKAMRLGADYVATGHYARIRRYSSSKTDPQNPSEILGSALSPRRSATQKPYRRGSEGFSQKNICSSVILIAKDGNKDQSYFLSFIKPEVLSRVLFPIGDYTKPEVRVLAKKFGLPNAERKESQGICFIGKVNFDEFLKQHILSDPGEIVDTVGTVLGKHDGLALYTIGQRKGIRLSGGPYYVVRKDFESNRLVVSKNEEDLKKKEVVVVSMNWFSGNSAEIPSEVEAKIRYRTSSVSGTLSKIRDTQYKIQFSEPQRAVTPGQFAVLYKGEELLGGGVIG